MLILAFETSAKAASVALLEEDKLLGESYQNTGLTHSQTLMVMAQDLLKQCGKTVGDVNAVAVAQGPGSFTGVRIGVAAAKGFAWGGALPCCGVSTLEAMALSLGAYEGYVCPVMDARRSQVYNALFRAENGKITRISEDRAIALSDLAGELKALDGPIFLVGDGSPLTFKTLGGDIPSLILPPEHRLHQRATGVALLAAKKIAAGETADGNTLTPNYLRLSQAERERLEKQTP
ncbi:MAG: tRNA (adenosine(37)-N6)-threonylcarbamoyltransferase complex dimerization subunit type 1 TsaB [Eubacteriales bacterium]|nr:tRNA (adenosine(37)-N6)-threonylcarbamoyltransferase complex dimerization subunit type 1 TsaB [Eubacteriales bacterium]